MYGYYTKNDNNTYTIDIILSLYGSGYNVVPKSVDKWNAYDITEVQAYAQEHPEMEVVWSEEQLKYIPIEA